MLYQLSYDPTGPKAARTLGIPVELSKHISEILSKLRQPSSPRNPPTRPFSLLQAPQYLRQSDEKFRSNNLTLDRKKSHLLPKHLRGRAISPRAPRPQTRTPVEISPTQISVRRRYGPLGDRSLPRRSSDYIRRAKNINAPSPLQPVPENHRSPKQQRPLTHAHTPIPTELHITH